MSSPDEDRESQHAEAPPAEREGFSALLAQLAAVEPEPPGGWARGPRVGDVVGRFELLRELGRGGFGVVYEARDRELGRLVAFKAVRPGNRARSAQRVEWLRREAEATAQLNHENIVALYDAGRAESGPFLVFELLEGETLGERLERGPLPPRDAIRVTSAIARALAYAHAAGVLHRDLKPSNVFLTERGQVKVLDFGLAHVFGWTGPSSGGTAAFMAPEQWRGDPEDGRTDVFAAGVMLHEMLTGRLPYELHDGRSRVLDPQAPAPVLDGVPPSLRPVVASAIAARPDERPRSAEVLLERLLEAEGALAAPERSRRPPRRAAVLGAGLAMAAAVASGAWWLASGRRGESAGAPPGVSGPDSVDAYRHYFAAMKALDANGIRFQEAEAELVRALEIDPEFALAHYLRAYLGEFTEQPVAVQRANAEAAARHASRLPDKEQRLVRAWAAHARGDGAEARRIYREAVDRYPNDGEVLYFAADLYFHADELAVAVPLFERAVEARPGWGVALWHLLEALDALGRRAELLAAARRAVAASPNSETYAALGRSLGADDPEEAVRAFRRAVATGGGPWALQQLSDGLVFAGRLEEAEAEGRALLAPEMAPEWQLEGYHQVMKVRALQGRHRELLRLLDEIPAAARASNLAHHHETAAVALVNTGGDPARLWLEVRSWGNAKPSALLLAQAGDLAHAAELSREIPPGPQRELYEGHVAWRRGDRTAATARLQAATAGAPWKVSRRVWLSLGAVLGELGRDREALEALGRFRGGLPLFLDDAFGMPRALLLSARSLERLGRRDEALRDVDELLALWKHADADLPELAEARALRGRLVTSGTRTKR